MNTSISVPSSLLELQAAGLTLRYKCDLDMTCGPGIIKAIFCGDIGDEFARIYWDGLRKHRLHTPFSNFKFQYQEDIYGYCQFT